MSNKPIAIVSGVGQGFGEALCRRFASAGYHVAALARSDKVTRKLSQQDDLTITPIQCDLLDSTSIDHAFKQIQAIDGDISVWIHNASLFVMAPLLEVDPQDDGQDCRRVEVRGHRGQRQDRGQAAQEDAVLLARQP